MPIPFFVMNNKYIIDFYRLAFLSLNIKKTKGKANLAKPALILSVIRCIEDSLVHDNKLEYQILKPVFEEELKSVQEEKTPLRYPFFHMQKDGFWHITWKEGITCSSNSPSDKFLRENVKYASFDNSLWNLLQGKDMRTYYKQVIKGYYFSEK